MRITDTQAQRLKMMPQYSNFYLLTQKGSYIWTGRVDAVAPYGSGQSIKVTTLSGDITRIVKDMTVWVGTEVNPTVKGLVRFVFRNGQYLVIAPNSINVAVGDIFSVDIVPRLFAINTYHDYGDILPTNPFPPYACFGPHRYAWTGEPIFFHADQSWAQRGKTVTSYSWDFGPNSIVAYPNNNSATPGTVEEPISARWQVPGDYVVKLTVTDSAGSTHTAWRVVIVRDSPNIYPNSANGPWKKFNVSSMQGAYDTGGWEASFSVYEQATKSNFPDGGVCILVGEDYFADQVFSAGGQAHLQDIVFSGYIHDVSTGKESEDNAPVNLRVTTAHEFAKSLTVWPANFAPTSSPNVHHNIDKVTLADVISHLAQEHSTLSTHNDVLMYRMDKRVDYLDLTEGKLWDQLGEQTGSAQLAYPVCSRYGQIYIQRDANHRPQWMRGSYGPPEFVFDNSSWHQIDLGEELPRERVAQVDAIGVYICTLNAASATNISALYSLYPPLQASYGDIEKLEGILVANTNQQLAQWELDEWAMLHNAKSNIRFPLVTVHTFNLRHFEPAEQPYVGVTLEVTDTLEGWVWDAKEFVVRSAEFEINTDEGYCLVTYGLEDSIWGSEGQAGEYPPGAHGPDYSPFSGSSYTNRTGKSVLACWPWGVVECRDVFTPPQNWEDRTGNLVNYLGRTGQTTPRLNGVERDPTGPTKKWWAWGQFGVALTTDRGSNWNVKFNKYTFDYWAKAQGYTLSADELDAFAVVRHKSPATPSKCHAMLVTTKYPGNNNRSRLWWVSTTTDWDSVRSFRLITDNLYNPVQYSAPNVAHCAIHDWPGLQPTGMWLAWIATGQANSSTVQLWRSIDMGTNWENVVAGDVWGYGGLYPDRIIMPSSGNDDASVAWWVSSGVIDDGAYWWKITDGNANSVDDVTITRQMTLAKDGPTFGVGFDAPFAAYPFGIDYYHAAGHVAQGAFWEKRGTSAPWRQKSAPPGPYQGFAQWPYNFDICYLSTNGPFANNAGMFYYTKNGGDSWDDGSSNLYQLMVIGGQTVNAPLFSLSPDATV